jgi:hypothetical protein
MIHLLNCWEANCIGYVHNGIWMGVRYYIFTPDDKGYVNIFLLKSSRFFFQMLILFLRHFAGISAKMSQNNAFTVAKRTLEGQDMIYQSLKLSNGIWALVGKPSFCW